MANANEIILKLTADNQQLKAKLDESKKAVDKTSKDIEASGNRLAGALKSIGTAVAGFLGVQLVKNLANTAKEVNEVSKGFENLAASAEGGSQGLLKAMKTASKGTMAELEMMKSANLAIQLMGEDVIQYLPKMAEISAGVAKAQGVEASQMLNDMVRAAGRQSVMILDNLGVSSVRAGQLMEEYASKLGKTRDQLTESEKSAAFFYATMKAGEEVLQRSGGVTEDFSTRLQRLQANVKNLWDNLAKLLLPVLDNLVSILLMVSDAAGYALDKIQKMINYVARNNTLLSMISSIPGMQPIAMGMRLNAMQEDLAKKQPKPKAQIAQNKTMSQTGEGATYVNYSKEFEDAAKKVAESFEKMNVAASEGKLDEVAKQMQELQKQGLLTAESNTALQEQLKNTAMVAKEQQYAVQALSNAFSSLEGASKQAIYEMLWGEGGWENFKKRFKEIAKQFVAEILYMIAKLIVLQSLMEATGFGAFGSPAAGFFAKFFERGYIPNFQKGRIPAFPSGYIPNDHFLAYIGTKEAVIRKEATQANRDILAWMNANNGQRYSNEIMVTSVVQIDGKEIGRAVDKYRDSMNEISNMKNYYARSLYR